MRVVRVHRIAHAHGYPAPPRFHPRSLGLHGVGGVARGHHARVEDPEPGGGRAAVEQRGGREGEQPTTPPGHQATGRGGGRSGEGRGPRQLQQPSGAPAGVGGAGEPDTAFEHGGGGQLERRPGHGDATGRAHVAPGREPDAAARGEGAAREDERQLAVGLVPGGHGRVGEQDRGVRGHGGPERRGAEPGRAADRRGDPGELGGRGQPGEGAERREDPRAHRQRRGRLEHAQHVQEPARAAEVVHERADADQRPGQRREAAPPAQRPAPGHVGERRDAGGRARGAAEVQVERDVGHLPGGALEDRPPVVGAELGVGHHQPFAAARPARAHRRPPRNAAATVAATVSAAAAAWRHMEGRSRVVTTGSGGSP